MARTPKTGVTDDEEPGGPELWDRIAQGKKAFPYGRAVTATILVMGVLVGLWYALTTCNRPAAARPKLFPTPVCRWLGK